MLINYKDTLVDSSETLVCSLTNGNLQNIISGEGLKEETAFITNKRLYYNHKVGLLNIKSEMDKIDLEDITGTRIVDYNPILFLVLAGLFFFIFLIVGIASLPAMIFVGLIWSIVFIVAYVKFHKKFLFIEYAGGNIHFSLIGYSNENIRNFQNSIYLQKDKLKQK